MQANPALLELVRGRSTGSLSSQSSEHELQLATLIRKESQDSMHTTTSSADSLGSLSARTQALSIGANEELAKASPMEVDGFSETQVDGSQEAAQKPIVAEATQSTAVDPLPSPAPSPDMPKPTQNAEASQSTTVKPLPTFAPDVPKPAETQPDQDMKTKPLQVAPEASQSTAIKPLPTLAPDVPKPDDLQVVPYVAETQPDHEMKTDPLQVPEASQSTTVEPLPTLAPDMPVPKQQAKPDQDMKTEPLQVPEASQSTAVEPLPTLAPDMPVPKQQAKPDQDMKTEPLPVPGPDAIESCLRRPDTCDFANNETPMSAGPCTRVLLEVSGVMQVVTLPMTRDSALKAGMKVVDDIAPAKTTFQPTPDPAEANAAAAAAAATADAPMEPNTGLSGAAVDNHSGTEHEATDDETATAKRKPSSQLTPEARYRSCNSVTVRIHVLVTVLPGKESKTTPPVQDVHAVPEIREELLVLNKRAPNHYNTNKYT